METVIPYCPECNRSIPVNPDEGAYLDMNTFTCPHCGAILSDQDLPTQTFTLDPGLIETAAAAGFIPEHFGGGIQHMQKILPDESVILLFHPDDAACNPEGVEDRVRMVRYADDNLEYLDRLFDGAYPDLSKALKDLDACEDPDINPFVNQNTVGEYGRPEATR